MQNAEWEYTRGYLPELFSLLDNKYGWSTQLPILRDLFQRGKLFYKTPSKDWRSTTSILTPTESKRFKTALFRLMTFHAVFQRKRLRGLEPFNGPKTAEDLGAAAMRRQLLERDARMYLSQFSEIELLQVCEFFEFQNSIWFWLTRWLDHSRECLQ